jgi:hypothetical protein
VRKRVNRRSVAHRVGASAAQTKGHRAGNEAIGVDVPTAVVYVDGDCIHCARQVGKPLWARRANRGKGRWKCDLEFAA